MQALVDVGVGGEGFVDMGPKPKEVVHQEPRAPKISCCPTDGIGHENVLFQPTSEPEEEVQHLVIVVQRCSGAAHHLH